jgi:adenine-specific DNA-methyltransferase
MNFKAQESPQKLRGAYYTPAPIALFLARSVLRDGVRSLLEPSCGDGALLAGIERAHGAGADIRGLCVDAVEINEDEARKAEQPASALREVGASVTIVPADFLKWILAMPPHCLWDAVLANPPYIRYQYFDTVQREHAEEIYSRAGVEFTKRANAWVAFLLASVVHLSPGGYMGVVLPAEVLHIPHARSVRRFLEQQMESVTLVSIRELSFPGTLQGTTLLVGRKATNRSSEITIREAKQLTFLSDTAEHQRAHVRVIDVNSVSQLLALDLELRRAPVHPDRPDAEPAEGEWMQRHLSAEERRLIGRLRTDPCVQSFVSIASVDVGIVTGANDFFVVDLATLNEYQLHEFAHPMLARSHLMAGITYSQEDHEANVAAGKRVFFLTFPARPVEGFSDSVARYLALGEKQGLHTRYKCRIREPWYVVPSVWATELALLKRCHSYPRLVLNDFRAYSTDTAYRIRLNKPYSSRSSDLTISFLNSLTFLLAELEGRHYGGGVLELVPSEIERLLVPLSAIEAGNLRQVDSMIRAGVSVDDLLDFTDPLLLGGRVGLTADEIWTLRRACRRMRGRRMRTS